MNHAPDDNAEVRLAPKWEKKYYKTRDASNRRAYKILQTVIVLRVILNETPSEPWWLVKLLLQRFGFDDNEISEVWRKGWLVVVK